MWLRKASSKSYGKGVPTTSTCLLVANPSLFFSTNIRLKAGFQAASLKEFGLCDCGFDASNQILTMRLYHPFSERLRLSPGHDAVTGGTCSVVFPVAAFHSADCLKSHPPPRGAREVGSVPFTEGRR
jgi:hypothetical protein